MSSGQDAADGTPTKACHNCRRRRLKCDRSTPACEKCKKTGQECLGYGKLFLWNHGVASRGKMMGKNFPAQAPASPQRSRPAVFVDSGSVNRHSERRTSQVLVRRSSNAMSNFVDGTVSLQPSLVDPLFQDLGDSSRRYLSHFANQLCADLVTYDLPNLNPFRDLIPLSREHAVLLHIAMANGAIHLANLHSIETQKATATALSLSSGELATHMQPVQVLNHQSSRFYRDALIAKQKALKLLRNSLEQVNAGNRDILLAAIHLFANFELLISGKGDCIVHVEGARKLIETFGQSNGSDTSITMSRLRDHVISDCLTFYILGSTVSSQWSRTSANRHFQYVLPFLERAESNSYLSCPSVLLQIMLSASYLCSIDPKVTTEEEIPREEEALALMRRAQSFDIHAWAQGVKGISSHDDFESRVHVATAHKSAICLYIHRAVPTANLLNEPEVESLVCDIIYHLSCIDRDDSLIKGTAWPTFVAGAESETPERRAWAAERLGLLWRLMFWGYLPTALETLQVIWSTDDSWIGATDVPLGWLQKLRKLEIQWMIV